MADNPLRAEYLSHIEKQKISGLSVKKYCEQNKLVEHKFSYYRGYKLVKKPKRINSQFAEVKVKSTLAVEKSSLSTIDPIWLAKFINQLLGPK